MRAAFAQLLGELPAIFALYWSQQGAEKAACASPGFRAAKKRPDALLHVGQFERGVLEYSFFGTLDLLFRFVSAHLLVLLANSFLHQQRKWGCSTLYFVTQPY
jgi:hypothetical protein